jgi:hypothetical protein
MAVRADSTLDDCAVVTLATDHHVMDILHGPRDPAHAVAYPAGAARV